MSSPMTGVPAAQLAQPRPQEQGTQGVEKQGASKFDGVLAHKAQALSGVEPAHAPHAMPPEAVPLVALVTPQEPPSRVGRLVSQAVDELEQGQRKLEALIEAGASGREFSNAELLSLQASMYKYTQELDLTGKVVEKATSGLKDLAKTQV